MEGNDSSFALRFITILSGAIKGMAFYPPSHPSIHGPVLELYKMLSNVLATNNECSCGVIDNILFFEDHLFATPTTSVADLSNRFIEKGVGRIVFSKGVVFEELEELIRSLSSRSLGYDDIKNSLQKFGEHCTLIRVGDESYTKPEDDDQEPSEYGCNRETYTHALNAIRGVCRDIERGRIPNSAPIINVVDRMVSVTMKDPSTLIGLTMIKDYDNYTFNHCINVGVLAMALGAASGLDPQTVKALGIAGQLHDIGKTLIPKEIINKPGKLSSTEFEEIKRHPDLGAKIIRDMEGLDPQIAQIVLGHHLNFNRTGYPQWAQKLPFNKMIDIVSIADTYDAITTLRVYQHPVSPKAAITEMQKLVNTILDGELVRCFVDMLGVYPVGTLVRLDTNEVAVVYRPNPLDPETPVVRILIESDGRKLSVPREQRLLEKNGVRYASIVAVVDPMLKNIDIGKFVISGNY